MNPSNLSDKLNNMNRIVELIIRYESITRTKLAKMTRLSPATITNLIKELMSKNIVLERGKNTSGLGRKAKLLEFNSRFGYVIGLNLDPQLPSELYLADLKGEILEQQKLTVNLSIDTENTGEKLLDYLAYTIRSFIDSINPQLKKKVIGIGVAVPAVVNFNETVYSPRFNWNNIPFKASIQNALGIPTFIENITRTKSINELQYIDMEKDRNVIYLALSPGIGMVNFYNGKMIRGKHSFAGEIGHMSLDINGAKCYCGNNGCFELYCGENNLLDKAKALIISNQSGFLKDIIENDFINLNVKSLYMANDHGDMKIHELLVEAGRYLGCALANIINCYDPDKLILSGDLIDDGGFVYNYAIEEIRKKVIDCYSRSIPIEKSRTKSRDIIKGISSFVLSKRMNDILSQK